jgi:hypothetical protein
MNIFILNSDPVRSALDQCDKHIVKMPLESAQMLSTAHRILDGTETKRPSKSGKTTVKYWALDNLFEDVMYAVAHRGHPCTVWTMETKDNYMWHYKHFVALANEYKYRYNREHLSYTKLNGILRNPPKNIPDGGLTPFPQAMPDDAKDSDPVQAYRNYYGKYKQEIAVWKNGRPAPNWWGQYV